MTSNIIAGYVIGFIDAEASFSASVKYQRGYGIRLDPVFNIISICFIQQLTLNLIERNPLKKY